MINDFLLIFILLILLGNIYTSYQLFKSDFYEKTQKIVQFFIIWCIPIIGMSLILFFIKDELSEPSKSNNNAYENGYEGDGDGSGGD
ncbi:MAG: hypothetical protein U9P72_02895 [Campylobacterota bacterium]|nr:hypothetical protein [Campylobacterota bacterium]